MIDAPAARKLIGFSVLILTGGFAISLFASVFQGFDPLMADREDYGQAVALSVENLDASARIYERVYTDHRDRQYLTQAHAHGLNFVTMMLVFAVLLAVSPLTEKLREFLVRILIAGVIAYPAGLMLRSWGDAIVGHVVAGFGAVLIILFVVVSWLSSHPRLAAWTQQVAQRGLRRWTV